MTLDDLNMETVHQYRNPHKSYKPDHALNNLRTLLVKKCEKKSANKKVRENTLKQYETILSMMSPEEWYQATDFMDVLQVKERRIQVLLKELLQNEKIVDNGKIKGRKYKKVQT